jgi:hypothetical protein
LVKASFELGDARFRIGQLGPRDVALGGDVCVALDENGNVPHVVARGFGDEGDGRAPGRRRPALTSGSGTCGTARRRHGAQRRAAGFDALVHFSLLLRLVQ